MLSRCPGGGFDIRGSKRNGDEVFSIDNLRELFGNHPALKRPIVDPTWLTRGDAILLQHEQANYSPAPPTEAGFHRHHNSVATASNQSANAEHWRTSGKILLLMSRVERVLFHWQSVEQALLRMQRRRTATMKANYPGLRPGH